MKHHTPYLKTLGCLLLGILCFTFNLSASVPPEMNYQAFITNVDGTPLPTGNYTLEIRIFDAADGGSLVWGPEIFDGGVGTGRDQLVPVVDGNFNLVLGPEDTLGRSLSSAFTGGANPEDRFIEIKVGTNPPISPRQQMLSAPYALAVADNAVGANQIATNAVGRAEIAPGAVGSGEIAVGAVGFTQLALNGVYSSNIADGQVGSSEIANNSVAAIDIAANAITSSELANDSVFNNHIADNAIGSENIANNNITSDDIGFNAVGASELAANSVFSADIVDGSVGSVDLASFIDIKGSLDVVPSSGGTTGLVRLSASSTSGGEVFVRDSSGNTRAAIDVLSDGGGFIKTVGPNGNDNVSISSTSSNANDGDIRVYNANGEAKIVLQVQTDNRGKIFADDKFFLVDHPTRLDRQIVYVSLEGPEGGIYHRGVVQLEDGEATIELPEHFSALAISGSITVNLTPQAMESNGVGIRSISTTSVEIQELRNGNGSYPVHFMVNAVRLGHENHQPVISKQQSELMFSQGLSPSSLTTKSLGSSPSASLSSTQGFGFPLPAALDESKTENLPTEIPPEEITEVFVEPTEQVTPATEPETISQ